MTIEEELRTCYANLRGHQDRNIAYIKLLDERAAEIRVLEAKLKVIQTKQADSVGREKV